MKISQREARRLKKRVEHLESVLRNQRAVYGQEWPGGVEIGRFTFNNNYISEVVRTARKLGHAVVAVGNDTETVRFIALPHPEGGA
jgi:hypothetical protein